MGSRWRSPRGPSARRSHTPPPKSAPPRTAYALSATKMTPATRSARVTEHPTAWYVVSGSQVCAPADRLATDATTHHSPRSLRSTGLPPRHVKPPPFRHHRTADEVSVQEPDDDHAQEAVEQGEGDKRHDQPRHRGDGVTGLQDSVDHPWLPAELGHHPARLDGHEAQRGGERD